MLPQPSRGHNRLNLLDCSDSMTSVSLVNELNKDPDGRTRFDVEDRAAPKRACSSSGGGGFSFESLLDMSETSQVASAGSGKGQLMKSSKGVNPKSFSINYRQDGFYNRLTRGSPLSLRFFIFCWRLLILWAAASSSGGPCGDFEKK